MSRTTKCICDGCGREIEKNPIAIYAERVDVETGELRTDPEDETYWANGNDYCKNCIRQVIEFVENLPKSTASAPEPHSEVTTKSDSKKPTIRELLEAEKTAEEIMQITGRKKASIDQIRYQMTKEKLEAGESPVPEVTEEKIVRCSEVIKTCEYAGKTLGKPTCDYAIIVGHSRGCSPEQCTQYKRKKESKTH